MWNLIEGSRTDSSLSPMENTFIKNFMIVSFKPMQNLSDSRLDISLSLMENDGKSSCKNCIFLDVNAKSRLQDWHLTLPSPEMNNHVGRSPAPYLPLHLFKTLDYQQNQSNCTVSYKKLIWIVKWISGTKFCRGYAVSVRLGNVRNADWFMRKPILVFHIRNCKPRGKPLHNPHFLKKHLVSGCLFDGKCFNVIFFFLSLCS